MTLSRAEAVRLTYMSEKAEIALTEKLTNRDLLPPTPNQQDCRYTCQILYRYDDFSIHHRSYETSWEVEQVQSRSTDAQDSTFIWNFELVFLEIPSVISTMVSN